MYQVNFKIILIHSMKRVKTCNSTKEGNINNDIKNTWIIKEKHLKINEIKLKTPNKEVVLNDPHL